MKKILSRIKSDLIKKYQDTDIVFNKYMDRVFEFFEDEYQISEAFYFFNGEKRLSINKNKLERKRVAITDTHIATQFFTPKWLVQYIVDNSLGRLLQTPLLFSHGEGGDIVKKDSIKILDPAVGTGNMLVYAYELLEGYYREQGVDEKRMPQKILSSFYGLDIDKRAVDVAKRLLIKKSGLKNFDIKIYCFEDISQQLLEKVKTLKLDRLNKLFRIWKKYKEAGSIIKMDKEILFELKVLSQHISSSEDKNIVEIIKILCESYDVILMNPPYLSSSDYALSLKEYIYENYSDYKHDMFACFIKRGTELLKNTGFMGVVCPYNWMFIKTFSKLRKYLVKNMGIYNLMQLTAGGYDKAVVYLSAFVVAKQKPEKGCYIRLTDFKASLQREYALKAVKSVQDYTYIRNQDIFLQTPNYAIIYWTSQKFLENFKAKKLNDYMTIRQGMATGDNKRFLRKIDEVDKNLISFTATSLADFEKSDKIFALYNKGGKYRKWWGNLNYVIKFDKASRDILKQQGNRMPSRQYYFKECITWTLVSSKGHFGARYSNNSVFDVGGSCAFVKEGVDINIYVFLGFLCSKVATYYLNALNPTLNVQVGDIKNLPFIPPNPQKAEEITRLVKENIEISKNDWYNRGNKDDFIKIKQNEQRLNQIFIEIYSLQGELDWEVKDRLITLKGERNEK